MPLYEYKCLQCSRHTEKIQKFSDPEITICPHCGGTLERVLSAPAISFKGGGWYADGYGSVKPADTGKDSSKTAAPASSGSESAPAAAPAAAAPAPSAPAASSSSPSSSDK